MNQKMVSGTTFFPKKSGGKMVEKWCQAPCFFRVLKNTRCQAPLFFTFFKKFSAKVKQKRKSAHIYRYEKLSSSFCGFFVRRGALCGKIRFNL